MIDENRDRGKGDQRVRFISSKRRKKLKGREYPVSIRLEVLSLVNRINMEIYNNLNTIRNSRNNWLHNLSEVEDKIASLALQSAQRLLSEVVGVQIQLSIQFMATL